MNPYSTRLAWAGAMIGVLALTATVFANSRPPGDQADSAAETSLVQQADAQAQTEAVAVMAPESTASGPFLVALRVEEPPAAGRLYLCDANGFKKLVDDCRRLDCNMLRIGILPMTAVGSYEKALDFAKQANEQALRLKEEGIDLYYHNHNIEFVKYGGEYLLDIIRENAPDMGFELDTHWIHRGGENPVTFIKKYTGRIRLLHLKDYRIAEIKIPEGLEPGTKEFANAFFSSFGSIVQFAEVGEGSIPMKECIEAGLEGGSEYFLVEQDETYGCDRFESLKISRDNLVKLGYADWF